MPFETLEQAFGPASLGILIVSGLPLRFALLREKLLQYASYIAHLPRATLESLTVPEAKYLVGWSHGKETLKPGTYDTLKGSYYVNCAFHQDPSLQAAPEAANYANFPEYTEDNVWPPEDVLPGFRATFQELCSLVIDIAALVARACDRYATAHMDGYEEGYLERVVSTSMTTKARLLHYFPPDDISTTEAEQHDYSPQDVASVADEEDSWCATHLDHGCLTGLTSALFVDESAGLPAPIEPLPTLATYACSPDPAAGLYIRSREGNTTKVAFPADCLAFQTGESLERITGGKFRAVPHFVRGPGPGKGKGVARNTLAVFTQPNLGEFVDKGDKVTFAEFAKAIVSRNT